MTRLAPLLAVLAMASTASAAPIGQPVTFDFAGPGIDGPSPSLSFTEQGVTVTATAPAGDGDVNRNFPGGIIGADFGLGVGGGGIFNSQIDSSNTFFGIPVAPGPVDQLQLDVAAPGIPDFTIESASFARLLDFFGVTDSFELFVDGNLAFSGALPAGTFLDFGTGTVDLSFLDRDLRTGNSFSFSAPGVGNGFKVTGITVTPNPEPASIALWSMMILGCMAFLYRRRQVAAAGVAC